MKIFSLIFIITLCFADYDPNTGHELQKYSRFSFQAKIASNGFQRSYASLDSLIYDIQNYGVKDIEVLDYNSLKPIKATKAFFVYKSNIKPSYGKYSIVAFETEQDAALHVKKFRGNILPFQKILALGKSHLQSNYKFMQKRYTKRAFPMGKKVYKRVCPENIDWTQFIEISDLKEFLYDEQPLWET